MSFSIWYLSQSSIKYTELAFSPFPKFVLSTFLTNLTFPHDFLTKQLYKQDLLHPFTIFSFPSSMDVNLQDPPLDMDPAFSSPPRAFGTGQPLSLERNSYESDEVEERAEESDQQVVHHLSWSSPPPFTSLSTTTVAHPEIPGEGDRSWSGGGLLLLMQSPSRKPVGDGDRIR
ncbi:hypothetical protein M8C21_019373 [Ambrosia artemisiifolia]|uniref:Uncharacterized protein n=1 Tax=Ambrosia artemisiifolia TaxID=4212 RepID=A0AAD5GLY2_AMBAR|nr:hypothetical protein M8C21_019373 [Ambrosia artemisiifolia]